MLRLMLNDELWSKLRESMLQHRIYDKPNLRMIVKRLETLFVKNHPFQAWEHKNKVIPGFAAKYNVHMLVYYEAHELYIEAARREKRFKNWPRQWKINLIEKLNPEWRDLYEEICQ